MSRFQEVHEREVGGLVAKGGYPDAGNGYYSKDLSYKDWYLFNNAQRAHYNQLEMLTPVIIWILITIMYQPLAGAILGFIYAVGRIFYTAGYIVSPNKRVIGALICDMSFLGLFVLSIVTIGKWLEIA